VDVDRWWLLSTVDTAAIRVRYWTVWHPQTNDPAAVLVQLIGQIPTLCAEIDRLARLLGQARAAYANLSAAARATLAARAEGEPDPWWYLRDELGHPHTSTPDPYADPGTGRPGGGGCA
jgi:hypothetical protein